MGKALKFRIVSGSSGELGSVSAPEGMPLYRARVIIVTQWPRFQKSEPDTDGFFPKWLEDHCDGFKQIKDDQITIEV